MTSYFDHFLIIKVLSSYITDSFIILFCVILMYILANYYQYIIPTRFQIVVEIIINHWAIVIKDNLGENSEYYILPLISLFMFILGTNLLGFFIYIFPPTTHITLTFGIAFSIWLSVIILGFRKFNSFFFSMFMPSGAPLGMSPLLVIIEIVSNISRPVALGMRLAANLTAGHILLAILSDFGSKLLFFSFGLVNLFPIFIMMFITILEVGVLIIQAYVFCLLSMIYLRDSIILH